MVLLTKVYNPTIIFATLALAFFGSYACITLYEQYRLCSKENKPKLVTPLVLLLLMAISIGGVAIWCMHFLAMSGVMFYTPDTHARVFVRYQIDLTITSLVVVIIVVLVGLWICSRDKAFVVDQSEVIESYIEEIRMKSIAEIRKIDNKTKLLAKTLFKNITPVILGGTLAAGGVCVMHYIGMNAIVFPGHIRWNIGIITASVIIALVAATAALWILFRLLALFPETEILRATSATIMAVAVNGMHYTGMAAGNFVYDPTKDVDRTENTVDQYSAALIAVITASLFLWIIFILAAADLRVWYHHLALLVRETDRRAEYYRIHKEGEMEPFLQDYTILRGIEYSSHLSGSAMRSRLRSSAGEDSKASKLSKISSKYERAVRGLSLPFSPYDINSPEFGEEEGNDNREEGANEVNADMDIEKQEEKT